MQWTPSEMGKKGGKMRALKLSKERRSEISSKAAKSKKGLKYKKKVVIPIM